MTLQANSAPAAARTVPTEAGHRHHRTCFWDVDDCRWQCVTDPLLPYALERCTATEQPVDGSGMGPRP